MTIRVTNATFESSSAGEFATMEDAYRTAIASGLDIATGEVSAGADVAIVQIAVDLVGRADAIRGSVAVSTARLMRADAA